MHFTSHQRRDDYMAKNVSLDVYRAYRQLRTASENCRYRLATYSAQEVESDYLAKDFRRPGEVRWALGPILVRAS